MKKILMAAALLLTLASCHRDPHFITDRAYRNEVHADFETRMAEFPMLELRLDTLNAMEREAMEFLYAYMPLCDLADYEPSFYLQQVRYAFKAREEMAWGKDIPEDVFRHFVLVYRVNNENLDTARMAFYRELKERVKGLSMEEAALEVNHWCHEHVAYRASDSHTSAPLATLRTALGRCGEESTFTVAALRAVGIPARQCYTPRWAHCDDNHAWVEVWIGNTTEGSEPCNKKCCNGEWKFMGACEPDPKLNMGWFAVPATRCMMVHTKAFGKYNGNEEVVMRTSMYSELNLISHYAPTRRVTITVHDTNGSPVSGAQVMFKLYNYAEYYTIANLLTDKDGRAILSTGLGDLLIWCTDGQHYAFDKLDVRKDSTMTLTLNSSFLIPHSSLEFEMVPPAAGEPKASATEAETAANAKRLAHEDSLRNAYIATFPTKETYKQLMKPNPNLTDDEAWELIRKSEGNYAEIIKYLNNHTKDYRVKNFPVVNSINGAADVYEDWNPLYDYLCSYSDKDLRDITAEVLESFGFTACLLPYEVFKKGLMPARISNELVRPYRMELGEPFAVMTAEEIRQWTLDSITVDDSSNYYNCPISPVGVYKIRHADPHSRNIFFVAACRSAGVPAYLDNATNTLYVWDGKQWKNTSLTTHTSHTSHTSSTSAASLTLTYHGKEPAKPVYWPHFTLAKLENGDLRTFDFEDDPRMAHFPTTIELEPGIYCLSTGNRYPNGAVRSRMEFFEVRASEKVTKEIVILPLLAHTDELGILDKNIELFDGIELWDYAGESGMLYVNLGEYGEPSKHLIAELRQLQKEMKTWGGMTFMVGPTSIGMPSWDLANTDFAYKKGLLEQRILEATKSDGSVQYPLVALIDKDGRIRYHSTGYKIGVIEQVLKAAKK